MTVMRDIAYAKAANIPPEEAINKIQDFQMDDGFFEYCSLPDICQLSLAHPTVIKCLRKKPQSIVNL